MMLNASGREVTEVRVGSTPIEQVFTGGTEVWRRLHNWAQTNQTQTITTPTWAAYVDIVCLGGGGGGGGGSGASPTAGTGGEAGQWKTATWYARPTENLIVTIGQGGAGGAKEKTGTAGGATTVIPSTRDLKCEAPGGAGGAGAVGLSGTGNPGATPGTQTFWDTPFAGGAESAVNKPGNAPGGGGGPGSGGAFSLGVPGKNGAAGRVWYRFRSY
ncbi:MAG: hypothetical protein LKG15_07885 [Corynebacterium provencense]|jgi:hypothetical protein|uniref:glycine-rich domain-containing protein n=1 Tax=Corynebacterium provencense TaxID=1737425 RepID=UPI002989F244|nr:hypothetical protein [Corynebacterium provencense]